ncbi:MAG: dienelactone hydrolase family protein [Holosporaceae bacterium]|nr:dienelactone hydrolase family protein [Holosporaceae bacterium]
MGEFFIRTKGKSERSIFFFHGYGADKENLVPAGIFISKHVPNADVIVVDGVELCDKEMGYRWFSYDKSNRAGESEEERARTNYLQNFSKIESSINDIMVKRNIHYENVVMMGFSQGASVSLDMGLRKGVLAIVSFAGALVDPDVEIFAPQRTKVMLAHGTYDNVVPFSYMKSTKNILQNNGVHVECIVEEGQGHCISIDMLNSAVEFLNGTVESK